MAVSAETAARQSSTMRRYYRMQSRIYDATRWSFLFGRKSLLQHIPLPEETDGLFVEIGCGTGFNLKNLAEKFPNAQLRGIDVSDDMLNRSHYRLRPYADRTRLLSAAYQQGLLQKSPDLILFSYVLTMINPQWKELINAAAEDLRPGGYIAVVDFHESPLPFFKEHMSHHHVRMDGHLLPVLTRLFRPTCLRIRSAYAGAWDYVQFVGRKEP